MSTRISFSYPEETREKLTKLAKKDGRTLQGYVKKLLLKIANELRRKK